MKGSARGNWDPRDGQQPFRPHNPNMLPSTSPREALLACPPSQPGIYLPSLWSPPFPPVALALISLSLSRQGAALAHLDSLPLMIWCFGLTALFLFLLARAAPAYLPTALFVALRPLFPFQQAQYVQVFLLKHAPFSTLFVGLGSTNKSVTSLLLLPDSRSVFATLSSPPSLLLPQTLWQI